MITVDLERRAIFHVLSGQGAKQAARRLIAAIARSFAVTAADMAAAAMLHGE